RSASATGPVRACRTALVTSSETISTAVSSRWATRQAASASRVACRACPAARPAAGRVSVICLATPRLDPLVRHLRGSGTDLSESSRHAYRWPDIFWLRAERKLSIGGSAPPGLPRAAARHPLRVNRRPRRQVSLLACRQPEGHGDAGGDEHRGLSPAGRA